MQFVLLILHSAIFTAATTYQENSISNEEAICSILVWAFVDGKRTYLIY